MKKLAALVILALATVASADSAAPSPPEARQFDFWLGEWDVNLRIRQEDLSWQDSVQARARIYPVLGGQAVLELWDSEPIKGFSLRYFDVGAGKWMLWLNWPGANRSGSSGLSGSFHHGRGDFYSERQTPDGATQIQRYSFNDITPHSLRWDDAYSVDGGESWTHQWRMEFSRTDPPANLDPNGGDGHTYGGGERCDLEQFRHFEALAGRRQGRLRTVESGAWVDAPAELVGYRVLDGCAVLATLSTRVGGRSFQSFHQLTWNTYASVFEETVLDSRPDSSMSVYYGAVDAGAVSLRRRPVFGEEITPARRLWRFTEDAIEVIEEVPESDGEGWNTVSEASFAR